MRGMFLKLGSIVLAIVSVSVSVASATTIAAPEAQDFEQSWVTGRATVRSGPGSNYRIVNRLKRGDFVNVGDCRRGWCYVDVYGGSGYILERVIGEGENPYHNQGPAEPGYIPQQAPGTR